MKAVFLSYNQALTDRVNAILDEQGIRGFTRWALTEGRGSVDGEPHYGTHAPPPNCRARGPSSGISSRPTDRRAFRPLSGNAEKPQETSCGFFRFRRLFPPRGVWCYAPPFLRLTVRPLFPADDLSAFPC